MNEIKFECVHCRQRIACDDGYAGRSVQCPTCYASMVVPTTHPAGPPAQIPAAFQPQPKSARRGFPWLIIGCVGAPVLLGAFFVPHIVKSINPPGPFESITWRLTDRFTAGIGDRGTSYSISKDGETAGLCFLVVDFRLPPSNIETFEDNDSIEAFKLHPASGSHLIPSSATYSGTRIGESSDDALTEIKGTILFTVEESAARGNNFKFQFKLHPQVLLNNKNFNPDA